MDDVAFVQPAHGFAIGEAVATKGIKKKYYLETRGDVLLRNKDLPVLEEARLELCFSVSRPSTKKA